MSEATLRSAFPVLLLLLIQKGYQVSFMKEPQLKGDFVVRWTDPHGYKGLHVFDEFEVDVHGANTIELTRILMSILSSS